MNSREIIQRTLDFDNPERVAQTFGDSDLLSTCCSVKTHATDWVEVGGGRWENFDEWGNKWARIDATSKGEVVEGVLENIDDLDSYMFPDYSHYKDYVKVAEFCSSNTEKWVCGGMPGFAFNIARKMRKLDQYLMDLVMEPERMHELHDRIDVMLEDMIRNYAAAGVDSVMFCEDWGTQGQTLISPDLWLEEFFPRFKKLCGIAHELGIKVFMHSCGKIEAIVPMLMEAGIDLLQFDQPELHGLDKMASYHDIGRITFWCPVDIQTVLQSENEEVIRIKAREMLDKLWKRKGGGFIAGYYSDNESIGLDPKWQNYASDEFKKYGIK